MFRRLEELFEENAAIEKTTPDYIITEPERPNENEDLYENHSEEKLYENISEEDNLILPENDKTSANIEDPWSFVRQPIEFIQSKVFAPIVNHPNRKNLFTQFLPKLNFNFGAFTKAASRYESSVQQPAVPPHYESAGSGTSNYAYAEAAPPYQGAQVPKVFPHPFPVIPGIV